MHVNQTKARLKSGETVLGCFFRYPCASLVEFLAYQPWDFLVFDGEHGTLEPRDCEDMVRAAELRQVTPVVRVPANQPPVILRYLDTGAQGLHVPWINSKAEAERVIRSVKYQPVGIRGLAGVRAADYGQAAPLGQYVQQANAETLTVIHIETAEAVEALPRILEVEGLDVIFIGPTDLSHSLGVPGQTDHPTVQAAMERIAESVNSSAAALGILVSSPGAVHDWHARGARYIAVAFESLVGKAGRDFLTAARIKT